MTPATEPPDCEDCAKRLTPEEFYFYYGKCEGCERAWHERIEAWRTGKTEDVELSNFYKGK